MWLSYKRVALTAGALFLVGMAVRYPLQTTFPIGGDAVRHVARASQILTEPTAILTNSNYPASIALLASAAALPLSWPERFIWLTVVGHVATGLALGWLLYRHFSWQAAAVGMAGWGLVITTITRHVEDATLAQLLSLPIVVLCLERFMAGRFWVCLGLLLLAGLLHPFSFVYLGLALGLAYLPQLATQSRWQAGVWWVVVASLVVLRGAKLWNLPPEDTFDMWHLFSTHGGVLAIIGVFGVVALWQQGQRGRTTSALLWAGLAALILSLTTAGGLAPIPHRYGSYLVIVIVLFFALGLPWLLRWFTAPALQASATGLVFLILGSASWQADAFVYNFYESNTNYARVHRDELAAMAWLKNNSPTASHVVSTTRNRHSEWIPTLAERQWTGVAGTSEMVALSSATHLAFFTRREGVPDELKHLPVLYENDGAIVLQADPAQPSAPAE